VAGLTEGGEERRESWDWEVEKVRKEKKRKRRRNTENGELKTEVFIWVVWKQGDRHQKNTFIRCFLARRCCVVEIANPVRQTGNYKTEAQEYNVMQSK